MKKTLSVILTIFIIISVFPMTAFANDKIVSQENTEQTAIQLSMNSPQYFNMYYGDFNPTLDEWGDYDYDLILDYKRFYKFTAQTGGYYEFKLTPIDASHVNYQYMYIYSGDVLKAYSNDSTSTGTSIAACYLDAGETVTITVYIDFNYNYSVGVGYSATFTIEAYNHEHTYSPPNYYGQWIEHSCMYCSYSYEESTIACPHTHTSLRNVRYPSGSTPGYTGDLWCDDCLTILTTGVESFNICPHSKTYTTGSYSATYFEYGFTGNKYCSDCGVTLGSGTNTAKKKPTLSSVKSTKKKTATVKWSKVKGAVGYEVQYSTKSNMKSPKKTVIKKGSTTSANLKNLTSKKKIYVRIRAYKIVNSKKVYSPWSSVKNVKIK